MAWTRYDVFLSYAHEDAASSGPLAAALSEKGYKVFCAEESIRVGEPWKTRLGKAIRTSRVCILCWSENARASEYVSFEYACAEASGKPVLPWLLDSTPLPQMIESQGVSERDPARAAVRFLPHLGWRLALRHRAQVFGMLALLTVLCIIYRQAYPPPQPWEFGGRVRDTETWIPISGVRVEAEANGSQSFVYTNAEGKYILYLPPPKSEHIHLVFVKEGYEAARPVDVNTHHSWDMDMRRLR